MPKIDITPWNAMNGLAHATVAHNAPRISETTFLPLPTHPYIFRDYSLPLHIPFSLCIANMAHGTIN